MMTNSTIDSPVRGESAILISFAPKGSMCLSCTHAKRDCSALDFASMQPMIRHGRVTIVKCTGFSAAEKS